MAARITTTHGFEVSVRVALVVDVADGSDYLTEEDSRLVLGQTVLRDDVVEELAARAVLRETRVG